jgi:hypothetical protein
VQPDDLTLLAIVDSLAPDVRRRVPTANGTGTRTKTVQENDEVVIELAEIIGSIDKTSVSTPMLVYVSKMQVGGGWVMGGESGGWLEWWRWVVRVVVMGG